MLFLAFGFYSFTNEFLTLKKKVKENEFPLVSIAGVEFKSFFTDLASLPVKVQQIDAFKS